MTSVRLLLVCSLLFLVACGSDSEADLPGPDVADVAGEDAAAEPDVATEPDVGVPTSGVRAVVLDGAEDGIGGRAAMAVAGDVLLENEHVRFVVRTQDRGLIGPYGGNVIDADVTRAAGEAGNDRLLELFPMIGFARVLRPDSIEIVDDGRESGTAVLRLQGTDTGVPLIDSFLPTQPQGLHVTLEYRLTAEARYLEVVVKLRTDSPGNRRVSVGAFAEFGDAVRNFHHRCGDDAECLTGRGDVDWLGASGGNVAYALTAPAESDFRVMLARERILLVQATELVVPPGEDAEARMFLLVGGASVDELADQAWGLREAPARGAVDVTLSVDDERSSLTQAWIEARLAEDGTPISATAPDKDGHASLSLPPDRYQLHINLPGTPEVVDGPFEVTAGASAERTVALDSPGWLHATVADEDGAPLDALVLVQTGHDVPDAQGASYELLVTSGEGEIALPAGDYTVVATHGYAYDIARSNITVSTEEPAAVTLTVKEVIPTPGELFMDTHDHCEYSIDSDVLAEDRVRNALAMGIDVLSTTDHDTFRSLQPVVEALGADDRLLALSGNEISPLWGHQVGIGCPAPEPYVTFYDVPFAIYDEDGQPLRATTPSEIWRSAREDFGCELVVMAHPWCSQAAFEYLDFLPGDDPESLLPDADLGLLDALELVNSHDEWDELFTQNVPGWLGLLDRGMHLTALGGSDEHGLGARLGHPRNLVKVPTDDVAALDHTDLYGAIKEMRTQVVGGPVIRVSVDDAEPGDTLEGAEGPVHVKIEVLAAPWVPVDYVRVYANGVLVMEPVPTVVEGDDGVVVRLDHSEALPLSRDTHIVVAAGADHNRMGVAGGGRPSISVTNPVFVDVDADGYRAPRAPGVVFPPQVTGPPPSFYDCRTADTMLPEKVSTVPLSCIVDHECRLPMVVAHRGAGGDAGIIAPENSLSAVRAALYMGVDGVELDVRHTADDQLVLMHDSTVDRTTTGTGEVEEMTLAEIQALSFLTEDYPRGDFSCDHPPTLSQALAITRDRMFVDLDCKTDRMDLIVPAIVDAGLIDQVFVSTGSVQLAAAARAIDPRIRIQVRPGDMTAVEAATETFDPDPDIYEVPTALAADAAVHVHARNRKVFCDVFHQDAQHVVIPDSALYLDVYADGADVLQSEFPPLVLDALGRWRWW